MPAALKLSIQKAAPVLHGNQLYSRVILATENPVEVSGQVFLVRNYGGRFVSKQSARLQT